MSYLSEVGLCLTAEAEMKLLKSVEEAQQVFPPDAVESISNFVHYPAFRMERDEAVLRYWPEYSWHEVQPEVGFIMEFLSELECQKQADSFYLCRVGENPNDNEWLGGFYDNPFNLRLFRKVVFTSPILSNAPLPPIK